MLILIFSLYFIHWDLHFSELKDELFTNIKAFNFGVIRAATRLASLPPHSGHAVPRGNPRTGLMTVFLTFQIFAVLFTNHYDLSFPATENIIKKDSVFYTRLTFSGKYVSDLKRKDFLEIYSRHLKKKTHFLNIEPSKNLT